MEPFRGVSDSELILMKIIWDAADAVRYADIAEKLSEQGIAWPKNMINMLLLRLADKGLIKTGKIGRKNEYTALVSRDEYNAYEASQLIERLYDGDVQSLVNTLGKLIPESDKEALRQFWKDGEDND